MMTYTDAEIEALWIEFGTVPVVREAIDEDWLHFVKGTPVLAIWHWFDTWHSDGVVMGCMSLSEPEEPEKPAETTPLTSAQFTARLPMSADDIIQLAVVNPDTYVLRIINAAFVLSVQGRGHYIYQTSWLNGATHWKHGTEDTVVPAIA
jgi:hypothetical protein